MRDWFVRLMDVKVTSIYIYVCESPGNCFPFSKHKRNSALNMVVNQFPYLVAIIPTILLDTGDDAFIKREEKHFTCFFGFPVRPSHFILIFHLSTHTITITTITTIVVKDFKPIDHVLDYSRPVACQTFSGTELFPCICQLVSLSSRNALLFGATAGPFLENARESIPSRAWNVVFYRAA